MGEVLVKSAVGDHLVGWTSASGLFVPTGGTTGQVLTKNSNADYDVSWQVVEAFEVGDYHFNSTGINPAVYLGYGTWIQVAQGLLLVGAP